MTPRPKPARRPALRAAVTSALLLTACATTAPPLEVPLADPDQIGQYATTVRFSLGHPRAFQVVPDGSAALFLRTDPGSKQGDLFELNVATGQERVLLTAAKILQGAEEELSEEERARRERTRTHARGINSYSLSHSGKELLVPLSGRLYVVNRASGATREIGAENTDAGSPMDARFSADDSRIAFVRGSDVYVADAATGAQTRLTKSEAEHVSHGVAEFVAQEEMGRYRGFWWSPDGARMAIQRTDESQVETLWIHDPTHPAKPPRSHKFPRAGTVNADVRLGVFAIARPADGTPAAPPVWIEWDRQAYPYLVTVRWQKRGPLTLVVQNRAQTELVVLAADPETGETRRLHMEHDAAWLNIDQSVPHWLPGGDRFLWSSERDGMRRVEVRSADGEHMRWLTPSTLNVGHIDSVHDGAAIVSGRETPLDTHLYRVPLDGSAAAERITGGGGHHSAAFGRDAGGAWVHTTLGGAHGHRSVLRRGDAEIATVRTLASPPPFVPEVEFTQVGARGFHAAIVRPRDFEEGRQYPVVVYVYGGPTHAIVSRWPTRYFVQQWIADHGFVVVMVDARGTPWRGRAWQRSVHRDVISLPVEDQVTALQALGERYPELDLTRVGIYGWSFGGYFSSMAVMRRPDVFHSAVSVAPVADWHDYDTHYTERYMGVPAENRPGYRSTSLLTWAPKLERPLLVIHGTADDNVFLTHTLRLSDALFRAGRAHVFLPLSGFTHMVHGREPSIRLWQRIARHFVDTLQP